MKPHSTFVTPPWRIHSASGSFFPRLRRLLLSFPPSVWNSLCRSSCRVVLTIMFILPCQQVHLMSLIDRLCPMEPQSAARSKNEYEIYVRCVSSFGTTSVSLTIPPAVAWITVSTAMMKMMIKLESRLESKQSSYGTWIVHAWKKRNTSASSFHCLAGSRRCSVTTIDDEFVGRSCSDRAAVVVQYCGSGKAFESYIRSKETVLLLL
jgi:hypothetical protein